MDYRLESIGDDKFEKLINSLCEKQLGTGTVDFTTGPDGGRDGRFNGTADNYPSNSEPWSGRFIIQSKHTEDHSASCSDNKFHGNNSSTVEKEIERLNKLKAKENIDCYLIFTNRKETSKREEAVKYIKTKTSIPNVDIIGKATINRWLQKYDDIRKIYSLDIYQMPFDFFEDDIRDVIVFFHENIPDVTSETPTIDRPDILRKVEINNLSLAYYENILVPDLNRFRPKILKFLSNPRNRKYTSMYEESATDLKRLIETNIDRFSDFKHVFNFLTSYIIDKDPQKYKRHRNIFPAFFHFMFYQCDIGRNK